MRVVEASFVLAQEADNLQEDGLGQTLQVEIVDGGGGPFLVLSTERWAIDPGDIDAFAEKLKDLFAQVDDSKVEEKQSTVGKR